MLKCKKKIKKNSKTKKHANKISQHDISSYKTQQLVTYT